jgi:hypothetical protein
MLGFVFFVGVDFWIQRAQHKQTCDGQPSEAHTHVEFDWHAQIVRVEERDGVERTLTEAVIGVGEARLGGEQGAHETHEYGGPARVHHAEHDRVQVNEPPGEVRRPVEQISQHDYLKHAAADQGQDLLDVFAAESDEYDCDGRDHAVDYEPDADGSRTVRTIQK